MGELSLANEQDSTNTDLVRGSIVINCLAKYGLQAEEMANLVFFAISGNKRKFYKRGMHSLTGLSVGEESLLRSNSDIELTAVPVSLQYSLVKDIYTSFSTYDLVLHYTPPSNAYPEREWYEGAAFDVAENGTAVTTYQSPDTGSTLSVSYVESISGETRTKQPLVGEINGTNSLFILPSGESALGYYKVMASGLVSLTQGGNIYPITSGVAASGIEQDIYLSSGVH